MLNYIICYPYCSSVVPLNAKTKTVLCLEPYILLQTLHQQPTRTSMVELNHGISQIDKCESAYLCSDIIIRMMV